MEVGSMEKDKIWRGNGGPGVDSPALLLLAVERFKKVAMGFHLRKCVRETPTGLLHPALKNDAMECEVISSSDQLEDLLLYLRHMRIKLSTAANMCRKLPSNVLDFLKEVAPLLINLLSHSDEKVLEHASVCLTRITEAFTSSPKILDELCNHGLVAQAAGLVSVRNSEGQASLSTLTYTEIIRLLSICASGSPLAAKTLLLHGISGTLKDILSGSVLVAGITVSPTITSPSDQIFEIVNLADNLLPPLPAGTIFVPKHCQDFKKVSSIRRHISNKQSESGSIDIEVSDQEKLLRDQPELLQKLGSDILPAMTQVYGSNINGPVRHKCLSVIAKLMYYSSGEIIEFLLDTTNISSFLAGILSWKDPQVLIPALQIAKILVEKLTGTFPNIFVKEGVLNAIESLICPEISSLMLSQVSPRETPVSSSSQSVRQPSTRSKSLAAINCVTKQDTQEGSRNLLKGKGKAVVKSPSNEPKGPYPRIAMHREVDSEKDIYVEPPHGQSSSEIFINHGKSTLRLEVKLDEPSKYMMEDYRKRLNVKYLDFYFAYNSKIIDPNRTLCSYGILKGCTIHVNNRIRGGKPSFLEYIGAHKAEFSAIQKLPDGNLSLKLTIAGCRFTSSLLSCFTSTWSKRKSWDGWFSWDTNFRIDDGVVSIAQKAKGGLQSTCMENDIKPLIDLLDEVFYNKDIRLRDHRPPYFNHLISTLKNLKSAVLSEDDKLILSSHVCAMGCYQRLMLGIALRIKYKGLSNKGKEKWDVVISKALHRLWLTDDLLEMPVFKDLSSEATQRGDPYQKDKKMCFRLIRDYGVHCLEHRWRGEIEKFTDDDGVELMIPMHLNIFLARLVEELIIEKIDISKELSSAVVHCSKCTIEQFAHPVVPVPVEAGYIPTWMRTLSAADLEKLMQTRTGTYIAASPQTAGTTKSEQTSASKKGKAPQTASISSREPPNAWNTVKAVGVTISDPPPNTVSPVTTSKNTQGAQTSNPKEQANVWKRGNTVGGLFPGTASPSAAANSTANTPSGRASGAAKPSGTASGAAKKNPRQKKIDWDDYTSF